MGRTKTDLRGWVSLNEYVHQHHASFTALTTKASRQNRWPQVIILSPNDSINSYPRLFPIDMGNCTSLILPPNSALSATGAQPKDCAAVREQITHYIGLLCFKLNSHLARRS